MTDPMQRAVEAMMKGGDDVVTLCQEACPECKTERDAVAKALTFALPHLEAHFREVIAGEVTEKVKWLRGRPTKSAIAAWYDVAAFIRKGAK